MKDWAFSRPNTGSTIYVTLWGEQCETEGKKLAKIDSSDAPPILAINGGHVVELNGRTIETISNRNQLINPSIIETNKLETWFQETSFNTSSTTLRRKYNGASSQPHEQKTIVELNSIKTFKKAD